MINPFVFPEGYNFAFEIAGGIIFLACLYDFLFITKVHSMPFDGERSDGELEAIFYSFFIRSILAIILAFSLSLSGVIVGWFLGIILTFLFSFYLEDLEDLEVLTSDEEYDEDSLENDENEEKPEENPKDKH